jgi:hypothetical protein
MVPPSLRSKALQQVNWTKYIFFIKQQFWDTITNV